MEVDKLLRDVVVAHQHRVKNLELGALGGVERGVIVLGAVPMEVPVLSDESAHVLVRPAVHREHMLAVGLLDGLGDVPRDPAHHHVDQRAEGDD